MKREFNRKHNFWIYLLILIIGLATYFGTQIRFKINPISSLMMGLVSIVLLYFAYSRGTEEFFLAGITGISFYVALVNSFGQEYTGNSPITLHLVFGPWTILIISLIATFLALLWYERSNYKDKFPLILLVVYVIVWVILSVNVTFYEDWKMENWLTVPFVILLIILHRWFRLSNLSYGLIFAFMTFHIIGTHYTYAEVPFGYWIQSFFHLARNQYDRIVHFSFGFLLAYPMREVAIRISNAKGFWGFYIPVEFVLAFSAVYELIEWGIAVVFGGDLGIAYLGAQGDVWDAQKDMFAAGIGSIIAMTITFLAVIYYRGNVFWLEFIDSFKVKKKRALGEEAIRRFR